MDDGAENASMEGIRERKDSSLTEDNEISGLAVTGFPGAKEDEMVRVSKAIGPGPRMATPDHLASLMFRHELYRSQRQRMQEPRSRISFNMHKRTATKMNSVVDKILALQEFISQQAGQGQTEKVLWKFHSAKPVGEHTADA